jgi:phosphoribosyl isomerase A
MRVELLAAVDVAGRRATQVLDGGTDDPRLVARRWADQGDDWVHLVDLDRAYRRGSDLPYLAEIVAGLPVPVQLSGGLDTPQAVEDALATGARRVNLAATALRDPAWVGELVRQHGDRVAVGIDVAGDQVVARGSGEVLGTLEQVLRAVGQALEGARPGAFVVADATRDGRLAGADATLFRTVVERLDAPVVASGGVAGVTDLLALRDAGVRGVVLGAALHSGRLTLPDALEALR